MAFSQLVPSRFASNGIQPARELLVTDALSQGADYQNNVEFHFRVINVRWGGRQLSFIPLACVFSNQPLPTSSSLGEVALFVAMGVSTIAATWGHFTVKERVSRAKFAQHLQGVGVFTYWMSTFIWDIFTFVPPAVTIFIILQVLGVDDLVSRFSLLVPVLLFHF